MIRALAPAALAIALVATPAMADSRLVQVMYNEAKVFRIDGKVDVQASIVFGDDEVIENVAIGNSQEWQVTPNKRQNILFVKPIAPRGTTNLTVVTSKRTYLFDLVASPNAKPLYVLRFDYPKEPEPVVEKTPKVADKESEGPVASTEDGTVVIDPSELNFAWAGTGEANLLPERTFDDGTATYLTWPEGHEVPAILMTNAEGVEGPVNFTVRGDTIA